MERFFGERALDPAPEFQPELNDLNSVDHQIFGKEVRVYVKPKNIVGQHIPPSVKKATILDHLDSLLSNFVNLYRANPMVPMIAAGIATVGAIAAQHPTAASARVAPDLFSVSTLQLSWICIYILV